MNRHAARARCGLDLGLDPVVELLKAGDPLENSTLLLRTPQAIDRHVGKLVLLALHHIRVARVVL